MRICILLLAAAGLSIAADAPKAYVGTIGDDMCNGNHTEMGGTDPAKCTMECIKGMSAKYALWIGKDVYVLSDQKTPARYAGQKVSITGTLSVISTGKDSVKMLQVKSIAPAK